MPGGDRTGPMGTGPMTGRGAGFCGGANAPGFMSRMGGAFSGGGRGRGGRGWRRMFHATGLPGWARAALGAAAAAVAAAQSRVPTREEELDVLKQQANEASAVLEDIRKRISELESGSQTT